MNFILLVQSVLQIILESLPVSSSGHTMLVQRYTQTQPLPASFEFLLHGPTIIILMIYFRSLWLPLLMQCWRFRKIIFHMAIIAFSAESVTVIFYVVLHRYAQAFPLWLGFLLTAGMLFSTKYSKKNSAQLGYVQALLIGCVQGCAALPGISRLASTYTAGVWCGFSAHKAFAVSCMLQFPLICAGFLLGLYHEVYQPHFGLCTVSCTNLLVAATIISYLLLHKVEQSMVANTIYKFAYYMLIPMSLALFL